MKVWFKWLIRIGVLAFAGLGLYLGLTSSLFRVASVGIELAKSGYNEQLLFKKIKNSIEPQLGRLIGSPLWMVDLSEVVREIKLDTRVSQVRASRKFPSGIEIEIVPQKPVALLLERNGKLRPVGVEGDLLPSRNSNESLDLPILRGKEFARDRESRKTVVAMLLSLPESGLFGLNNISEIHLKKEGDYEWYLDHLNSLVRIQNLDFKYKASMVTRVLEYLDSKKMRSRVIDARFSKKVVVRLRNDS